MQVTHLTYILTVVQHDRPMLRVGENERLQALSFLGQQGWDWWDLWHVGTIPHSIELALKVVVRERDWWHIHEKAVPNVFPFYQLLETMIVIPHHIKSRLCCLGHASHLGWYRRESGSRKRVQWQWHEFQPMCEEGQACRRCSRVKQIGV